MKNKKLLDDEYIQEVFKYYLKNDNYLKDALYGLKNTNEELL